MHASAPEDELLIAWEFFDVLLGSKLAVLEVLLPVNEFLISKCSTKMIKSEIKTYVFFWNCI
jgi:hypothetical protein